MLTEDDLVARKEADRAYYDALHALKMDHDCALVDLMADVREGMVDPQHLMPRKAGIKARYERDAKRLAIQYGRDKI